MELVIKAWQLLWHNNPDKKAAYKATKNNGGQICYTKGSTYLVFIEQHCVAHWFMAI